ERERARARSGDFEGRARAGDRAVAGAQRGAARVVEDDFFCRPDTAGERDRPGEDRGFAVRAAGRAAERDRLRARVARRRVAEGVGRGQRLVEGGPGGAFGLGAEGERRGRRGSHGEAVRGPFDACALRGFEGRRRRVVERDVRRADAAGEGDGRWIRRFFTRGTGFRPGEGDRLRTFVFGEVAELVFGRERDGELRARRLFRDRREREHARACVVDRDRGSADAGAERHRARVARRFSTWARAGTAEDDRLFAAVAGRVPVYVFRGDRLAEGRARGLGRRRREREGGGACTRNREARARAAHGTVRGAERGRAGVVEHDRAAAGAGGERHRGRVFGSFAGRAARRAAEGDRLRAFVGRRRVAERVL